MSVFKKKWVWLFLFFLIFTPNICFAQYMRIFGFGSRERAMGNAMTAEANGPSAAYYNPGALGKTKGIHTFMGYAASIDDLSLNRLGPTPPGLFSTNLEGDPFNDSHDVGLIHGIDLGLAMPLSKYIVVGTAAHLPAKGVASTKFVMPDESYWLEYESAPNNIETNLAVAIVPMPWISVGVGVSILTNIEGDVEFSFPLGAGNPAPAPSGPIEFGSELEVNWDFALNAGIWLKPLDFLEIGASYRGELAADTDLDMFITTDLNQGAGITQFVPLTIIADPIYHPQQASFGISLKLMNRLTISTDITWVDWSNYEPPFSAVFVGQLGPTTFAGVPFPDGSVRIDTTPIPPHHFQDVYVPRIGIEFRPIEMLFLRAGYYYRESPVPIQAGLTNIHDADTHVFSVGFGTQMDDPLQIIKGKLFFDVHGQLFLLESETNMKSSALGTADPDNEGLPGFEEGGMLWSLGFTTGIKF